MIQEVRGEKEQGFGGGRAGKIRSLGEHPESAGVEAALCKFLSAAEQRLGA